MAASTVAKDFADLYGTRGYPSSDRTAIVAENMLAAEEESAPNSAALAEAQAASLWRRGRFEHCEEAPVPWLWPVKVVLQALKKRKLWSVASSLRPMVEGGWPTQFQLLCMGQAEHSQCACGHGAGTLRHKLGQRVLAQESRESYCPQWVERACDKEAWHPLFSRGVPARPKAVEVPKEAVWFEAADDEVARSLGGDIYTDGSAHGLFWRAKRGGWSAVALDQHGRHKWTKRGTLGGLNISSHRAELRALLEALKFAAPPMTIHIDNKGVIDGTQAGREWCTSSKTADADLWRAVWDRLEVVRSLGEVCFVKAKAHTGWAEILNRTITPRQQFGNWLADVAAKASARHAEALAPTAGFSREVKKAVAWLRWVAHCAAKWVHDVVAVAVSSSRASAAQSSECEFGEAHLRHELWAVGERATCRRCGLTKCNLERQPHGFSWRCGGSAAGRAAAKVTGNINHVWAQYALSRQRLLQRGARLLSAEPPPRWMVEPNSLQEVARDGDHLRILQRILYRQPLDDSQQSHWSVPPWLRAPSWLSAHLVQPWEHEEEALRRLAGCARERLGRRDNEHRVVIVHALAYCSRCACFAHKRLGSRFKGQCQLPEGRAAAAVSYRLARLRSGLHPITGLTLDGHS